MGGPAIYLHAGFILISVANFVVILLLLVVFAIAVMIQLPGEPTSTPVENTNRGTLRKEDRR